MFIAGDFNEEPENCSISEVMNKFTRDLYFIANQGEFDHPELTTFKYRDDEIGWRKKTIDYIFVVRNHWYNNNLCRVLKHMDPGDLESEGLLNLKVGNPCENHPSDHYSLVYQVLL